MNKMYEVMLLADICITNAEQMINWSDQGWEPYETSEHLSLVITVCKRIVIETDRIHMYVDAISKMNNDISL